MAHRTLAEPGHTAAGAHTLVVDSADSHWEVHSGAVRPEAASGMTWRRIKIGWFFTEEIQLMGLILGRENGIKPEEKRST
jgi:hypothetical protein